MFSHRQHGQNSSDELKNKDFRKELEERERLAQIEKDGNKRLKSSSSSSSSTLSITNHTSAHNKKPRLEYHNANLSQLDADEKLGDD